jgi:hypothetical protein
MSEPVTMLTDYALGAVSAYLGVRLFRFSKYWAIAFLALALAAFLGGTWHGFWQHDLLWKARFSRSASPASAWWRVHRG